ncbi:hypothetical protein SARC_14080, partial [Sphaeroforma arctica JP610]
QVVCTASSEYNAKMELVAMDVDAPVQNNTDEVAEPAEGESAQPLAEVTKKPKKPGKKKVEKVCLANRGWRLLGSTLITITPLLV